MKVGGGLRRVYVNADNGDGDRSCQRKGIQNRLNSMSDAVLVTRRKNRI